jgi:hypothetical protein
MLRRIADAARALRVHFSSHHRRRRHRAHALRDAISAVCDPLELRLLLTSIDPISDQSISEGSTISIAATVNVDEPCDATIVANWGDGTSDSLTSGCGRTTLAFDHFYAHHGTFNCSVSVTDSNNNSDSTDFNMDVADMPPDLRLGGNNFAQRNVTYTLDLFDYDPGNDPLDHWTINWGDGNTSTAAGDAQHAAHHYTTFGDYTITATADDMTDWTWYANPASPSPS